MAYTHRGMQKIPYREALERFENNLEVYLLFDDNTESLAEEEEAIRYHHDELSGEFGVESNGVEDFDHIRKTVAEWKDKPHAEQFAFCENLASEIQTIDNQSTDRKDYSYRNTMVSIKRELQAKLPFRFAVKDKVIIKYGRRIKGVVQELMNPTDRSVRVKPLDNVHKEDIIVPESMLEHDVAPDIKEGQITLF